MTLKFILSADEWNSLESDSVKGLYVENGEQYVLDTDDVKTHPATKALVKAFESTKGELQKIKATIPKEDSDNTPFDEKVSAELANRDKLIQKYQRESEEYKRMAHEAQIDAILGSVVGAGVKSPTALRAVIKPKLVIDEKGRVYVRGHDGDPMLRKGAIEADDYLTVEDYKETLRADTELSYLFEPSGAKGGNAQQSHESHSDKGAIIRSSEGVTGYR